MPDRSVQSTLRSKLRWGIVGIFALLVVSGIFVAPKSFNTVITKINDATHLGLPTVAERPFRLGLDLQGGAQLIYTADVKNIAEQEKASAVEGVRDVIERRVNGMGVAEAQVQTTKVGEDYRLIVELPGVADIKEAIGMIGGTPILEFKEQNTEPPRELTAEEQKQLNDYNADAKKRIDAALKRIQKGEKFEDVAKEVSEDTLSKNNGGYLNFVSKYSPYTELFTAVENMKEGTVSTKYIETAQGYEVLKRGQQRDGEMEVNASHILVCFVGAQNCLGELSKEEALQKAKDLYNQANAQNFEQLARENSTDGTVEQNGGDLGWFIKSMMVPEFADAVFNAQKGQIIGPVESTYGYHIIYKKDERPIKEYEIWRILVNNKTKEDIIPPQEEWKVTGLSGKQLERSEVVSDPQTGAVQVSLRFNDEGKQLFAEITERNVGKPVAIFLDGTPISIPNVDEPIRDGQAVIRGGFTLDEARVLSQRLNAGALPVPVELISQQSIGATLGTVSLTKSLQAGIIGVILVMLFMALYYRIPGLLSVIALALYVALVLALFKLIGVTLTLAGIAGFILSIGMAVDANVLIFERMKEELRSGKSLKAAVEEGFKRAWPSIRDSNLSTLISAVLLIWFGTSFVKGFAVTLALGVILSMFTAIVITRLLIRFVVPWFSYYGNRGYLGVQKPKDNEVTE